MNTKKQISVYLTKDNDNYITENSKKIGVTKTAWLNFLINKLSTTASNE